MSNPSRLKQKSKRAGQTLVIALIVLGVLLAIGLVFLAIIGRNVAQTANSRQRSIAAGLSEAGARFAHQQMLRTAAGVDYRPNPTTLAPAGSPDITRDPDVLYLRPGTGLGLSLVAAVARLHEAELSFEDNHPGLRAVLTFKRVGDEPRPPKPAFARAEQQPEPVH